MAKKHVFGVNYLHRHPVREKTLNLDNAHVIVDRLDWEQVLQYFETNPVEAEKYFGATKRQFILH